MAEFAKYNKYFHVPDRATPNYNRMHGNDEGDLDTIKTLDGKQVEQVFMQNPAFVQAIIAAISAKNKLDYPPFGPTTPEKQQFQSAKIKHIINEIQRRYGDTYGEIGLAQHAVSAVGNAFTWGQNAYSGVSRIKDAPASTYKSAKALFGYKGGRRRKHRKTHRKQK